MRSLFFGKLELALLGFLVCALAGFYFTAHEWANTAHPWAVGDWLISYHSGFVRRGSVGSVIFWLNDLTGISLTALVLSVHVILFCILVSAIGYLSLTKRLSFPVLLLLISPACLLFPFLDLAGGGGSLRAVWCGHAARGDV